MSLLILKILVLLLFAAAPRGVATAQTPPEPASVSGSQPSPKNADPEKIPSKAEVSTPVESPDAFILGPEDVIYIRVMHEPDLTGPQDIRPDGMVTMQLIGELKAAGKTPAQLAFEIRKKLLETMRNPEVTVQLTKVNSRKFTIQGEVNRPGTFTFSTPITVLEALVNGQGFRDFANLKKIYILRKGQKLSFNYKAVSHGKRMEENIVVENGDQIFVP